MLATTEEDLLRLTAEIVAAHLGHNAVPAAAVPDVIRSVHAALSGVGAQETTVPVPEPAVPVKKSVFPDYLVCLEDGRKLKMLKRHLQTSYGLSPEAYRERWGLPASYPMVAPDYAARRSTLAKSIGLGRRPTAPAPAEVPVQRIPEGAKGKKAARPKKAQAAGSA